MTPIRVMQSYPAIRATTNPYIAMLDRAVASTPEVELQRFDWRGALFGRIDVIHFHWPETLFNSSTPLNRLAKKLLTAALVVRLRRGRVAVVRTVHNLELPADISGLQRMLLTQVERSTDLRIRIGETTTLPSDQPSELILHGDYREWFADVERMAATPGRLGFVGLVRRYKGVERLIEAFRSVPSPDITLSVSGNPTSGELADEIRQLAHGDPRISLEFGFLDDPAFVAAMTRAELVVLPYRFMHNSGSVLAALSLDRPVLVPRNDANIALAREVGEGWIRMYDGDLDAAALIAAIEQARPAAAPDLSARSWTNVGERHAAAYSRAVTLRRDRRSRRAR